MHLLIGLGNPGKQYAQTRHNFGFWLMDELARRHDISFKPGRGDYLVARGGEVILVKPTASMNNSGLPVREALTFFQAATAELLVAHDDIDLPLGMLRFRPAGGAGGHRGMESVIYQLGTEQFGRLRLGIATDTPMRPSEKYVLRPFRKVDQLLVDEVRKKAADGLQYYMENGIEPTMTRYNSRPESERS